MSKIKLERNRKIVKLRKIEGRSYEEIMKEVRLKAKSTISNIYNRDKDKFTDKELSTV